MPGDLDLSPEANNNGLSSYNADLAVQHIGSQHRRYLQIITQLNSYQLHAIWLDPNYHLGYYYPARIAIAREELDIGPTRIYLESQMMG